MALDVAEEFQGTVINADSMQVYRQLDVLTARPGPADLARAPHRLYGHLFADAPCSVGRWLKMAETEIAAAWADGRLPIVVGGTGMYIKALLEGLAEVPEVAPTVRAEAEALYARLGPEAFAEGLAVLDPQTAARFPATDRQRMTRAWEVAMATGRPLSAWHKDPPASPPIPGRFAVVKLVPERAQLYRACDARFDQMMAGGAIEEVRALAALKLDAALPAMKAVGVPELLRHVEGGAPLGECIGEAKRATRQFAKRQLTWLRNQMAADLEISAQYSESLKPEIFSFIRRFLLTGQT